MKENYQRRLDETLEHIRQSGETPRLLLHACCAPCSSYVLEYLSQYMDITLFYYNPNIAPEAEFRFRQEELQRLMREMPLSRSIHWLPAPYDPEQFTAMAQGLEDLPEGGSRCEKCYRLRLEATMKAAAEGGFDYVTTTLSISPYKNAEALNRIGRELSDVYGVPYLVSDFKKKNGYKRSCELSVQYNLYRQNYCGCVFSRRQAEEKS